jgi:diaminopimelate decarboxylase
MEIKELVPTLEPNIPCYCFDTVKFVNNIQMFRKMIGSTVHVVFSVKANPYLISSALEYVDGIEVCSYGEIKRAIDCVDDVSKITFGGICKEDTDWEFAINGGIRRFSIESLAQLNRLEYFASRYSVSTEALIRVSSGNQFGMDVSEAIKCFEKNKNSMHINIAGIHYYPGTMRTVREVQDDYKFFETILKDLKSFEFKEIEYGAGVSVDYFGNSDTDQSMPFIIDKFQHLSKNYQMSYEVGRYLAADCGFYIARVTEIKHNGNRGFVVLNGGRHQFTYHGGITSLGSRIPQITVIGSDNVSDKGKFTIVGALCSIGDILAKDMNISAPKTGDYIVFHNAGAYCVTEGITLFLSRDTPAIFLLQNGKAIIIKEKTNNIGEWGILK